jgi:hypothetical protein
MRKLNEREGRAENVARREKASSIADVNSALRDDQEEPLGDRMLKLLREKLGQPEQPPPEPKAT